MWEIRKHNLYDSNSGSGLQHHTQSLPRERNGKFSQNGKFGQNGKLNQNGKFVPAFTYVGLNVSSSAHNCGGVVDGGNAMATI